ncbi:LbetaH domain-containing protein [Chryseobacterium indoltheticum]|uniref:Acetyltransferase n=1 Tax=Chryseobacterium indoltheticum TaxID=254 RepID=A0A3G6NAW0_9FLAO|nr:acetyltransferase [Chryseobacterium indoltheticum]AZA62756.1 acetyltransferase [Chryseobacterium indoltheticum]
MLKTYGLLGLIQLMCFKIRTRFVFRNARIIRFPFRLRGKQYIRINEGFTTGFNCRLDAFNINNGSEPLIVIGKNVQINDDVHIGATERIEIHDNVLIASKVFITDHNHGKYSGIGADSPKTKPNDRLIYSSPVVIEKNVWIGEFVSILPGVTIGEGSIVGTMSVVNKNVPPFCIVVGSPARVVKKFDFDKNEWISVKND